MSDESRAYLNAAGLTSDRDLYLDKDDWTVLDTPPALGTLLARKGSLIPTEHVQRLGLGIDGGKIVQNAHTASGQPNPGPAAQSEPVPENVEVDSFELPDLSAGTGAGPGNPAHAADAKVEPTPAQKAAAAKLTMHGKLGKGAKADEDKEYDVRNSDQPGSEPVPEKGQTGARDETESQRKAREAAEAKAKADKKAGK